MLLERVREQQRAYLAGAAAPQEDWHMSHVTHYTLLYITWLFFDAIQPSQPQLQTQVQIQERIRRDWDGNIIY